MRPSRTISAWAGTGTAAVEAAADPVLALELHPDEAEVDLAPVFGVPGGEEAGGEVPAAVLGVEPGDGQGLEVHVGSGLYDLVDGGALDLDGFKVVVEEPVPVAVEGAATAPLGVL